MNTCWFPDNTVLCNFACVARSDLLKAVLDGRGRWTEAVADEAAMSARVLPDLQSVLTGGWMGHPIEVNDATEIRKIELTRRQVFGGSEDEPRKHLGEAQTCFILLNRAEYRGSLWISDDRDALNYARGRGLVVKQTFDLISEAVSVGMISRSEGYATLLLMKQKGNSLTVPRSADLL